MVMARVEAIFGWGTSSSPGMGAETSAGVAPHRLYHPRSTGAVRTAAAILAPPSMTSRWPRDDISHDGFFPDWRRVRARLLTREVPALTVLTMLRATGDQLT